MSRIIYYAIVGWMMLLVVVVESLSVDKGWNVLERASNLFPQGRLVSTAKTSWKFAWKRMMTELAPQDKQSGSYQRPTYSFTTAKTNIVDEPGRYHVYVGNPCPWCHRVRLAMACRNMNGEEIGMTVLVDDPVKASRGGWIIDESRSRDPLKCSDLRQVYDVLSPNFKGRCTAPLLVDLKTKKILSNESKDIVRLLNTLTFAAGADNNNKRLNLLPSHLQTTIDETNEWVYELVNNGVYQCGFSTQQAAYDRAAANVRRGLDRCETILSKQDYICGDVFTETDLYLLPTILRFDGAYAPLFHAGAAHLRIKADYPAILAWLQRCYDTIPSIRDTIDIADATSSYYKQLFPLNPGGILPTPITEQDIGLKLPQSKK